MSEALSNYIDHYAKLYIFLCTIQTKKQNIYFILISYNLFKKKKKTNKKLALLLTNNKNLQLML